MAYELPTRKNHPVAAVGAKGLSYRGEVIDYRTMAQIVCLDDEVEIVFRDEIPAGYRSEAFSLTHAGRKPLTILVDPDSSHQLPDIEKYIEAFMCQNGVAEWDEARDTIVNKPTFDCSRIKNELVNSYAIG